MNRKSTVIITVIVLILLTLFMFFDNSQKKKKSLKDQTVSQNIPHIAQPITFFSGIVDKIEGDSITLNYYNEKTSTTSSAIVLIGKNTQISRSTVIPFFYFISPSPAKPQQTDRNGLKIKDNLTITTKKSESIQLGKPMEAVSVTINNGPYYALVKIIKIEGNVLTVERLEASTNSVSSTRITINKDTEIVILKNDYTQLTTNDLKVDMQIDVYTERNLGMDGENNALQIIVRRST